MPMIMENLIIKKNSKGGGQLARALYTNNPDAKNELFFRKGDILTVIEIDYEGQAGWWLCSLRGDRGLCPGNYLEIVEDKYNLPQVAQLFNGSISKHRSIEALEFYDFPKESIKSTDPDPDQQPEYDVPKSSMPIYTSASLVRAKKIANNNSEASLLSNGKDKRVSSASSSTSSSGISANSFDCPSSTSESEPNIYANEQAAIFTRSNFVRSSRSVNNLRSCISASSNSVDVDDTPEYDFPRSSMSVKDSVKLSMSRPGSSMSLTTSKPLQLQTSESRDSGLDMYDVPRSVKDCLNIFECKYDSVQRRRNISGTSNPSTKNPMKRSSICSSTGSSCNDCSTHSSNESNPVTRRFGIILRSKSPAVNKAEPEEIYDVPPPSSRGSSRSPSIKSQMQDCVYDLPAETSRQLSICGSTETLSCSESYRESFGGRESSTNLLSRNSSNSAIMKSYQSNDTTNYRTSQAEVKLLPLCPKAAISVCEKLRQEVITAIQSLLNFVRPKWRVKDNLKEIMPELRFTCVRLNLAVKDFTEFSTRTISNAKHLEIDPLVVRLQKLNAPLINGSQIVQTDIDELEAYLWSVDRLSQNELDDNGTPDALDQIVMCARSLQHDATEIANFIALNSSPLFKDSDGNSIVRSSSTNTSVPNINPSAVNSSQLNPIPAPLVSQNVQVVDDGEDYDYVTLVTAEDKIQAEVPPSPPSTPMNPIPLDPPVSQLNSRDQQLLEFYSGQVGMIAPLLSQSISTFISSVHANDPPKIFNGHLKYVILLAYKMLFAGDTIHKNLTSDLNIKTNIELQSDELHKAVISLHEASKIASRDFPKILPMQKIVDHVWETTSAATKLKKVIFNACL